MEKADVSYQWEHVSSANGNLAVPNEGNQQTATLVIDVDKNGINDFIISERTKAPAVVWYRRTENGWDRYLLENEALTIEAGSAFSDIDGDGDFDIVLGGDAQSNQLWWWENPYPNYNKDKGWQRRLIKDFGAKKHHDQIFGDFDGDGKGDFKEMLVHTGFGLHESVLVDLNGDGLLDILGKPYTWQAPRLDIWINKGKQ